MIECYNALNVLPKLIEPSKNLATAIIQRT